MKRRIARLIFAGILAISAMAQEERAVLTGTITDATHAPVSGATVNISSKATGFHREVTTNDAGVYVIPGLQIGVYDVAIRKDGFGVK
jgi:hypothetical protein